jgi:predicted SAM-dependent methyltransferase
MKKYIKHSLSKFQQYYFSIGKSKVECNICGWSGRKFIGGGWHPNTKCPKCNSMVRHRLVHASIDKNNEIILSNIKSILHFAPDSCLADYLRNICNQYTTADFLAVGYNYGNIDLELDISSMATIESESYSCLIALDVLEHVPDHKNAIKEIYRILSTNGYCILTVPQKDNLETTFEDNSIVDPVKRKEIFGQADHLRIYGNDFKELMENAGFKVKIMDEFSFESEFSKLHGLFPPIHSKNINATNYRKIYIGRK